MSDWPDPDWHHGPCQEHLDVLWQLELQEPEEAHPPSQDMD